MKESPGDSSLRGVQSSLDTCHDNLDSPATNKTATSSPLASFRDHDAPNRARPGINVSPVASDSTPVMSGQATSLLSSVTRCNHMPTMDITTDTPYSSGPDSDQDWDIDHAFIDEYGVEPEHEDNDIVTRQNDFDKNNRKLNLPDWGGSKGICSDENKGAKYLGGGIHLPPSILTTPHEMLPRQNVPAAYSPRPTRHANFNNRQRFSKYDHIKHQHRPSNASATFRNLENSFFIPFPSTANNNHNSTEAQRHTNHENSSPKRRRKAASPEEIASLVLEAEVDDEDREALAELEQYRELDVGPLDPTSLTDSEDEFEYFNPLANRAKSPEPPESRAQTPVFFRQTSPLWSDPLFDEGSIKCDSDLSAPKQSALDLLAISPVVTVAQIDDTTEALLWHTKGRQTDPNVVMSPFKHGPLIDLTSPNKSSMKDLLELIDASFNNTDSDEVDENVPFTEQVFDDTKTTSDIDLETEQRISAEHPPIFRAIGIIPVLFFWWLLIIIDSIDQKILAWVHTSDED